MATDDSQAVEKRPSAAFCSSLVSAAYLLVRLIPRDFACLASGRFSSACEHRIFHYAVRVFPSGNAFRAPADFPFRNEDFLPRSRTVPQD